MPKPNLGDRVAADIGNHRRIVLNGRLLDGAGIRRSHQNRVLVVAPGHDDAAWRRGSERGIQSVGSSPRCAVRPAVGPEQLDRRVGD
jgi:hypothetical protein